MESFAIKFNSLKSLTIVTKLAVLDVCWGHAAEMSCIFEEIEGISRFLFTDLPSAQSILFK